MKTGKAILAAALAALMLAGCAAPETHDEAPDLADMRFTDEGSRDGDGLLEIENPDVPLGERPEEDAGAEVLRLVNAERAAQGLGELKSAPELDAAAAVRAGELAVSFSHTRPDGTKYRTALEEQGVSAGWTGENASMGRPTPSAAVAGWMKSEGHRANILKPEYTHAGAACFVDPVSGYAYWVLLLTSELEEK